MDVLLHMQKLLYIHLYKIILFIVKKNPQDLMIVKNIPRYSVNRHIIGHNSTENRGCAQFYEQKSNFENRRNLSCHPVFRRTPDQRRSCIFSVISFYRTIKKV